MPKFNGIATEVNYLGRSTKLLHEKVTTVLPSCIGNKYFCDELAKLQTFFEEAIGFAKIKSATNHTINSFCIVLKGIFLYFVSYSILTNDFSIPNLSTWCCLIVSTG